jgi:hypothetical protein
LLAEAGAADRADDTRRNGLAKPERIADGQYEIAHFEPVTVAHRNSFESARACQLKNCNVGVRITSH